MALGGALPGRAEKVSSNTYRRECGTSTGAVPALPSSSKLAGALENTQPASTDPLANDALNSETVADVIEQAADPRAALLTAWNSGKIVYREVAISSLHRVFPNDKLLPPEFESLALAAALDPDINVRETTIGILRERNHPALAVLAAEQLKDPDQQVR